MKEEISELKTLLQADREALLAGRFTDVGDQLDTIRATIEKLSDPNLNLDKDLLLSLQEVQFMAKRNMRLLRSAIDGAETARIKVTAIRDAASKLSTYTSEGQVEDLNSPKGTIEKRA